MPASRSALGPHTGVIVTGGASGIGRATALVLAESGRPVSVWDIDGAGAEATARECAQNAVKAEARRVDLADSAALEAAAKAATNFLGSVGGIAYVAGTTAVTGLDALATHEWDRIMDVNLKGPAVLTRLLMPELLRHAPEAAIVLVASTNAYMGFSGHPAYCASKAGVIGLARALSHGLTPQGVRVNTLVPGSTNTAMLNDTLSALPSDARAMVEQRVPMRRIADPRELAYPIRFLLSNEASYISGTCLVVDGGSLTSF